MANISIQWSPSPTAVSQIVQYKLHSAGSYTDFATVSPFTDHITVTGLTANTLYDFRIASDCDEDTTYTEVVSGVSFTCPSITASIGYISDEINLTYSFSDLGGSITQYKVYVYEDGVLFQTDTYDSPFSPTITNDIVIEAGKVYSIAIDVFVTSSYSKSCLYNDTYVFDCPTITSVTGSLTDDGDITIDLIKFDFSSAPAGNQTVHISWREESDPDTGGSYNAEADATVNPAGHIISPSPYTIEGLPETSIVIKVENDCGVSDFQKTFEVCKSLEGSSSINPQCTTGYIISSDGTYCYKESIHDADCSEVVSPHNACHYNDGVYNEFGTIFYTNGGYNIDGTYTFVPNMLQTALAGGSYAGTLWANPSSNTTDGRLNKIGVWDCDSQSYVGTLGFSQAVNISTSKVYYIGFSADNYGTIKINGTTIVSQDASAIASQLGGTVDLTFKYLHVYGVYLNAGINYIEVSGTNVGSIGIFGVEIYNATLSQLLACTTASGTNGDTGLASTNLHRYIVFSSKDVVDDDPFVIGNCNCDDYPGSTLILDDGDYLCKQLLTKSPT